MIAPATIIAIASPPGQSIRGIVRLSGAATFDLARLMLETTGIGLSRAVLRVTDHQRMNVFARMSRGPHSYTGEDSLELQMPGNPALLGRVMQRALHLAAANRLDVRLAEPGEFTARAYFNGRMTLTQAEGVAATIAARSDAELIAAGMLLSGRLGAFAGALAEELASALALVEAGIDFTDQDDVVAITPTDLHARLTVILERIDDHLARAVGIEHLRGIPSVVIVGRPNAGKSTLFNALLGRERAVVSPTAGTTRDALAEPLVIATNHGPAEIMLVDVAGLDAFDDTRVNALMQSAAHAAIDRADLRVRCVAPGEHAAFALAGDIIVHTKSDLHRAFAVDDQALSVCAITGDGLDRLRSAIAGRLGDRAVSLASDVLALQPRHEAALRSSRDRLRATIELVRPSLHERNLREVELVAGEMRAALDDLASLVGDLTPDDILGRIFASFCIGK